jgi:YidC/Oxa1 family membrane protein insertase
MYDLIASPLQFFYEVWPNYAGAIALLTLSIMLILLPLTLKGTRSMLAMQKLQPELKKLQNQHRDDRQKLNEEVMKFYKENNINPMSGCLPLLLQMPVFFFLYRTLYELLNRAPYGTDMGAAAARAVTRVNSGVYGEFGNFRPKHLSHSSEMYKALSGNSEMRSFGINLAESAQKSFAHGFVNALPFIVLVVGVTATSYYQQRQIAGRNPAMAQANPQQAMLMKILPLFFAFISLTLPAGIVVYFLISNLFRIGQQAFITRTMYKDEHGAVATTGRESDKTSTKKKGADAPVKPKGMLAQLREAGLPSPAKAKDDFKDKGPLAKGGSKSTPAKSTAQKGQAAKGGRTTTTDKPAAPSRAAAGPSRTAPQSPNRSKTKKKRK